MGVCLYVFSLKLQMYISYNKLATLTENDETIDSICSILLKCVYRCNNHDAYNLFKYVLS